MKTRWKIAFFITIIILVLTNLFWVYQVVDNAIGMTYYKDSCGRFQQDTDKLIQILESKTTKETAIDFLEQHNILYESFPKGNEFIIQLNSFSIIFNNDGKLLRTEEL